ncbi:hypothetical protein EVY06_02080 [Citrobacter koseri]|nr:hypothetical protein EVY06_02080 [Citrobacter koseri]
MRLNLTTPKVFWRTERHKQYSALITDFAKTKDFTLRQGGKRRKGRSIHRYVTEFTGAANAVSG